MKHFYLFIITLIFFSACGTKREYYQPTQLEQLPYNSKNINGKIVNFNNNIAQLNNNTFIDNKGNITALKIDKNYNILNIRQEEILIADNDGNFKILNLQGEELFSHKFNESVVSANVDGDDIALILASNTLVYANKNLGIRMLQNLGTAYAQDSRYANPYFLNTIIIYPMLNGKLAILNKSTLKVSKEILVSSEEFFNNIIYLHVKNNTMVAATAQKIIVVTPNRTLYLNENIKEVNINDKEIFILTKDGRVIKNDYNLRKIDEIKFQFALFSKSTLYNDSLYIFEKTGYLIKLNTNLKDFTVYKLNEAIDKKSFMANGKFFYHNKVLQLN
ncbi:hypothetical protein L8W40_06925 [Campylobacter sp. IFREMER_LSEM_CL1846]|uniref:hypothetical protein n=1 Tax=unclassified Campylobacter TaxID=2593542 RepID=UPI001273AC62|nr:MULTISPECIES: hypothetical protein [unclassified Campylobacter]EAJ5678463.1 hypothetical protein [Campylobacter lari]EAK0445078.1 hypothetical protein [Campylobacter lari]EAK9943732.1 hypothetical protein [Campylobacter lari]EGK8037517.1 hypothetical protein [Campylobacter lari]MCV3434778.1 hypothetical protein [Campylobacter sp. IFREMER_LSEM_CL1846]